MTVADIALDDVSKRFTDGTLAVENLDLDIGDGEFMVMVGPSGCGKTTALRMIAGLESITEGSIRIGEETVNDVRAKDRDIAMVFQNYALYPHMSVYDNLAFGLKLSKVDKGEIDRRVKEAARVLDLEELLNRKPKALSGGQRQRVAMGRAIVRNPQAFLMDEPLSNLDAKLRVQMRAEIARIQSDLNVTTVYVTHDQVEAMTMGDRVAVLRKGQLRQVGSPTELFNRPANIFVAGFIGSPSMNFMASKLEQQKDGAKIDIGEREIPLGASVMESRPGLKEYFGREVIVGIRPQDLEDAAFSGGDQDKPRLKAKVNLVEPLGTQTLIHLEVPGRMIVTEDIKELAADIGNDESELEHRAASETVEFIGEIDPKSEVRRGETAELTVDTTRMHFFDPDSGDGIYGE